VALVSINSFRGMMRPGGFKPWNPLAQLLIQTNTQLNALHYDIDTLGVRLFLGWSIVLIEREAPLKGCLFHLR